MKGARLFRSVGKKTREATDNGYAAETWGGDGRDSQRSSPNRNAEFLLKCRSYPRKILRADHLLSKGGGGGIARTVGAFDTYFAPPRSRAHWTSHGKRGREQHPASRAPPAAGARFAASRLSV